MAEYDLADVFEEVTLKIGDHRFKMRERTHSMGAKIEPLETKLEELPDDATDPDVAEVLMDIIELVLEPLGDGNGTRKHAKTILSRSYKNEEIGLDRLNALVDFLRVKMSNRARPTSLAPSDG